MIYLILSLFFCFHPLIAFSKVSPEIRIVNSYPIRSATNVNPHTGIGLTFSSALPPKIVQANPISVFSTSGKQYLGSLTLSLNKRTLIFTPSESFAAGDTISVDLQPISSADGAPLAGYSYTFFVRSLQASQPVSAHSDDPILEHQLRMQHAVYAGPKFNGGDGIPPPDPGLLNVTCDHLPYTGSMYLANYRYTSDQTDSYRMILNSAGNFLDAQGGGPDFYVDFKPNPDGTNSYYDEFAGVFCITDSSSAITKIVSAGTGLSTDAHEIRVTSTGDHFILANDNLIVNMSQYVLDGWPTADILVPIIQEYDAANNLVFEWRSIDYFKVTDATHEDLTSDYIDFCHINAIEFDTDSNLIISSRHMDEITKINRESGEIMWRLGGKHTNFTSVGDSLDFSHQHAIRRTEKGTFTMFDNGNYRLVGPAYSRALEFRLDQKNFTATKVWEYRHTPDLFAAAMGYVQRLPNGNTFIGWGECNDVAVTEVDSEKKTVFEMGLADSNYSYRAYKYDSSYGHPPMTAGVNDQHIFPQFSITTENNPVFSKTRILCSSTTDDNLSITLSDQLGRVIQTVFSGRILLGITSLPLRTETLASGTYYLRATSTKQNSVLRKIEVVH